MHTDRDLAPSRRGKLRLLSVALIGSVVVGCSGTTYDASVTTPDTAPTTTEALPTSGTAEELLPRLEAEIDDLPERIWNDDAAVAAADRIDRLWSAVRPDVEARWPDLVADFDFVMRLCRSAADRKRPANADRASRNLDTLLDATIR